MTILQRIQNRVGSNLISELTCIENSLNLIKTSASMPIVGCIVRKKTLLVNSSVHYSIGSVDGALREIMICEGLSRGRERQD